MTERLTVPAGAAAGEDAARIGLLARRRRVLRPRLDAATVIYRWDLDKTYLKSDFESLRKMMRMPFESAEDKVDEPGVVALIKALKQSARLEGRAALVYFISASPPQIGRAIREKLALDGIEADGIVFKDQLQHLMRGRFRYLREQVGFKLAELLKARLAAPPGAAEFLFGDDWESDPLIYSLYADVASARLDPQALHDILLRLRIDPTRLAEIDAHCRGLQPADVVRRIFINLNRRTPPAHFRSFGTRVVPTFNYFQTALVMHQEGAIPAGAVAEVGRSLLERSAYTCEQLRNSLDDLERRGHLAPVAADALRRDLAQAAVLPPSGKLPGWPRRLWNRLRSRGRPCGIESRPVVNGPADYTRLIDGWLASRGRSGGDER